MHTYDADAIFCRGVANVGTDTHRLGSLLRVSHFKPIVRIDFLQLHLHSLRCTHTLCVRGFVSCTFCTTAHLAVEWWKNRITRSRVSTATVHLVYKQEREKKKMGKKIPGSSMPKGFPSVQCIQTHRENMRWGLHFVVPTTRFCDSIEICLASHQKAHFFFSFASSFSLCMHSQPVTITREKSQRNYASRQESLNGTSKQFPLNVCVDVTYVSRCGFVPPCHIYRRRPAGLSVTDVVPTTLKL